MHRLLLNYTYLKTLGQFEISVFMSTSENIRLTARTPFEPGDNVLALFPILGKPLQARYYGPYTVDKKLSDVIYTVNTPGRCKQNSYCLANQ